MSLRPTTENHLRPSMTSCCRVYKQPLQVASIERRETKKNEENVRKSISMPLRILGADKMMSENTDWQHHQRMLTPRWMLCFQPAYVRILNRCRYREAWFDIVQSGPVKPSTSRYVDLPPRESDQVSASNDDDSDENSDKDSDQDSGRNREELSADESDDVNSKAEADSSDEGRNNETHKSNDEVSEAAAILEFHVDRRQESREPEQRRKRKNWHEQEDLEATYLNRVAFEEKREQSTSKRVKVDKMKEVKALHEASGSEKDGALAEAESSDSDEPVVHESLSAKFAASEIEKANRTVFLGNVAIEAVRDRKARKTLLNYLGSVLDKDAKPPQVVESLRFRSTPFTSNALPKRAAYIKKEVMDATTKSTHAYVVFSTPAAARMAVLKLNGTVVLDRHLRADSVAHPSPVAHRRCVFVGNLGFVDDESVMQVKVDEQGNKKTEQRKKSKIPMDVEEGLWRVFSKEAGKVESVRVVRDTATRVGKGFAYVQFYDINDVEAALLLAGKKFPPMLRRELRVSRCKAPHKTARAIEAKHGKPDAMETKSQGIDWKGKGDYNPKPRAEDQTLAGRANKLLGRAGAAQVSGTSSMSQQSDKRRSGGAGSGVEDKKAKSPEDGIFEGHRATAKHGKPKDLKFKGSKVNSGRVQKKKTGRGAARAAKWKAQGNSSKMSGMT